MKQIYTYSFVVMFKAFRTSIYAQICAKEFKRTVKIHKLGSTVISEKIDINIRKSILIFITVKEHRLQQFRSFELYNHFCMKTKFDSMNQQRHTTYSNIRKLLERTFIHCFDVVALLVLPVLTQATCI